MAEGMMAIFELVPKNAAIGLLLGAAVLGYFWGCFNGAVIVSKHILHDDVRNYGSGNAGMTNFHRVFGGKLTLLVIAVDLGKMWIAVFMARVLFSVVLIDVPVFVTYWTGCFCTLGHMFPVQFRFRGGKGILSGGALVLLLDWRVALAAWGFFFLGVIITRMISFGSCCAVLSLPFTSFFFYEAISIFWAALVVSLLILWQHRANIVRIATGKESKFSLKGKQVKK